MSWFRKKHKHEPVDKMALALIRADNLRRSGTHTKVEWRCNCGKLIDDETGEEVWEN